MVVGREELEMRRREGCGGNGGEGAVGEGERDGRERLFMCLFSFGFPYLLHMPIHSQQAHTYTRI